MENSRDNKFLTGFIWGAIIGAGVVFLLGTKKGKKLLKTISEEGIGNLSDLLEQAEEEEYSDSEDIHEEKRNLNGELKKEVKEENKKPLVRRFFRRTSK